MKSPSFRFCSMAKISEKDALAIIKSGAPFSIQFITADANRGTGGKRITSGDAVKRGSNHEEIKNGTITIELRDQGNRVISVHRKLIEFVNNQQVIC